MNSKHTPGPWHIGMKPGPMIYGSDSSQVADLRGDLLDRGEAQANARLIAAAPDLLAVMADLLADLDAIGFERDDDDVAGPECVDAVSQHIERIRAAIAKATGGAVMKRKYPPYGVKRDYPKIDLFARAAANLPWKYIGSSTWSRTCREAVDRYHACMGLNRGQVRAQFSKATGVQS